MNHNVVPHRIIRLALPEKVTHWLSWHENLLLECKYITPLCCILFLSIFFSEISAILFVDSSVIRVRNNFKLNKIISDVIMCVSGKMPTVVSPELYRSRFLEAMDRYFLLVPDRWTGLGRNVDY